MSNISEGVLFDSDKINTISWYYTWSSIYFSKNLVGTEINGFNIFTIVSILYYNFTKMLMKPISWVIQSRFRFNWIKNHNIPVYITTQNNNWF